MILSGATRRGDSLTVAGTCQKPTIPRCYKHNRHTLAKHIKLTTHFHCFFPSLSNYFRHFLQAISIVWYGCPASLGVINQSVPASHSLGAVPQHQKPSLPAHNWPRSSVIQPPSPPHRTPRTILCHMAYRPPHLNCTHT